MGKLTGLVGSHCSAAVTKRPRARPRDGGRGQARACRRPAEAGDGRSRQLASRRADRRSRSALLGARLSSSCRTIVRALVWAADPGDRALAVVRSGLRAKVAPRLRAEIMPACSSSSVVALDLRRAVRSCSASRRRARRITVTRLRQADRGQRHPRARRGRSVCPTRSRKPVTNWWNDQPRACRLGQGSGGRRSIPIRTASSAKNVGRDAIHRVVLFGFALLALFFLFKEGDSVVAQARASPRTACSARAASGSASSSSPSIHGTVNGLVLVGLGEGVLLGVVYFFTGVPHRDPVRRLDRGGSNGAVRRVGRHRFFDRGGHRRAGAGQGGAGDHHRRSPASSTTFTADHFVRPSLIGGTTKLPFIWVLLGILGGVETFGLLGLFVGPAVMAVLILLWRELAGEAEAGLMRDRIWLRVSKARSLAQCRAQLDPDHHRAAFDPDREARSARAAASSRRLTCELGLGDRAEVLS